MSRHTITVGIVAWVLLFSSVVLNVRHAVAVQANAWLGLPVWMRAERSNGILLYSRVEADPESAKMWDSTPPRVSHKQTERVASGNAPQEPPAPPLQREKRASTEEEATREGFVIEPIHLFLLGSVLIGLGMLHNRHRKV